jgi:hypothetical protein
VLSQRGSPGPCPDDANLFDCLHVGRFHLEEESRERAVLRVDEL